MLPETSIPPLVVKEVTSTFTTFDTKGILDGAPYKANETPLKLPRALPSAALQITEANVAPLPDKTDGVIIDSAKSSRVAEQSDNNQVLKGPALSALPRPEKGFKSTTTPPSRSDKVAMPTTPSTTTFLDGQLVQMKADQVVQSLPIQVAKASATVTFGARSDVSTPSTGTALKAVPDQVETPVLKPIGQASDRSNRLAPSHKGENLEVASTHKRDSSLETPSTEIAQDKSKPKGSMPLEITYRAATIGAVDPRNPDTNRFAGTSTNTLRTEPQLALQSQTIPSAATSMEIGYRDHKAYGRTPPSPQASEKEKSAQNSHSIRNSPAVPLTAQGVPVIPVVGTSPFEKTAAMDGAQPKDFAINLAPVPDSPEARRENTTSPKIE
ncbi:MAG: hypothetical protein KJO69_07615, partial [Gammaproteobacteria bacterium]|nr:hypothetical protein [Gammaproteobacteria bacterium]